MKYLYYDLDQYFVINWSSYIEMKLKILLFVVYNIFHSLQVLWLSIWKRMDPVNQLFGVMERVEVLNVVLWGLVHQLQASPVKVLLSQPFL